LEHTVAFDGDASDDNEFLPILAPPSPMAAEKRAFDRLEDSRFFGGFQKRAFDRLDASAFFGGGDKRAMIKSKGEGFPHIFGFLIFVFFKLFVFFYFLENNFQLFLGQSVHRNNEQHQQQRHSPLGAVAQFLEAHPEVPANAL
jgi:hypothetical protein